MAVQQRWGKRELERQLRIGAFEAAVLKPPKLSPAVRETHGDVAALLFKDTYAVEFLNLPAASRRPLARTPAAHRRRCARLARHAWAIVRPRAA